MKKIIKNLFVVLGLVFLATSCYDDYKTDYEYTATYFSMQSPLRYILMEDGKALPIEFGAMLSGRRENKVNESVIFEIDSTMLAGTPLKLLPSNYYTLSNESEITIHSGEKLGTIKVNFTDAYLNDPKIHELHYALPLRIVDTSLDSILPDMDSTIIALKCQNDLYAAYRVKGVDYAPGKDTSVYSDPDLHRNRHAISNIVSMDSLTFPYLGYDGTGKNNIKLSLNSGSVAVSAGTVMSGVAVSGTGSYSKITEGACEGFYQFCLDYAYTDTLGIAHTVVDTLIGFDIPMAVLEWR